ncbi:hypothetical protein [Paraburkholderia humisilvae]|uniref:hypothetical protein n=1 Tax=Paraburkholderia humisilvae TaxID=627669 RepID=UPI001C2E379A|nr:hypothetical protein [Paraburkholderia humisilvae]
MNKYETLALGNTGQLLEKYALLVEAASQNMLAPPNPASVTLQNEYDRLGFTTPSLVIEWCRTRTACTSSSRVEIIPVTRRTSSPR